MIKYAVAVSFTTNAPSRHLDLSIVTVAEKQICRNLLGVELDSGMIETLSKCLPSCLGFLPEWLASKQLGNGQADIESIVVTRA